jgi:hypothetical protein
MHGHMNGKKKEYSFAHGLLWTYNLAKLTLRADRSLRRFSVFELANKTTKSDYKLRLSVFLSVRSHGTTRLPLAKFSLDLIFEKFSKICRKKSFNRI